MRIVLTIITVKLNVALCGAHFTKTQSAIRIKALKQKKGSSLPRSLSGQLNKHNFQIIFKLHAGAQAESRDSGQQSARSPFPVPLSSFPTPHGKQLWALNFRSNTHLNLQLWPVRSELASTWLGLSCDSTSCPWRVQSVKKADEILLSKCAKNFWTERINERCSAWSPQKTKGHTLSALIRILLKLLQLKVLRRQSPFPLS